MKWYLPVLLLGVAPAVAQALPEGDGGDVALAPLDFSFRYEPPVESTALAKKPRTPPPFGEKGSEFLTFGGGLAHNFEDAWDLNLRAAYSQFLIEDVELSLEVNGWYFSQDGRDAIGINPGIVIRWHLVNRPIEPWTIFADVGMGVLLADREVPSGGTRLDFTPRVGIGYTHQLTAEGTRLQLGARWHHISNARISGDRNNPARDGLLLYGGIIVPYF